MNTPRFCQDCGTELSPNSLREALRCRGCYLAYTKTPEFRAYKRREALALHGSM